ncbi:MAG: sporulation protein YqfD, partial [Clostridia bacterium]|nr:sporulation protein YqfD [Clostridia bacterium]
LCYDYKIIGVKGTLPLAVGAAARLGFAAGLIAVLAAVCIFPQFVTRVSVRTADGAYEQSIDSALNASIESILSSHGVRTGKWLPRLDIASVEKSLLALDGVSYASVQRRGTHIDVRIKQEQPNDYLVEVYGSEVKSKKVAVVTRVIVEGGTAAVKYGDVVKVGDTLIDGYTMFGDDKLEVEAKGVVYGKVYYKKTVFFADTYTERVYGATKSVTKLSMFGKTPKLPRSPFEKYELETSVDDLGFLLPFKIYTYRYRELTEIERQNELTVEEMYAQIYSQIVAGFEEPIRVLDRYESVREADGGKYVTVTVEAEERIS